LLHFPLRSAVDSTFWIPHPISERFANRFRAIRMGKPQCVARVETIVLSGRRELKTQMSFNETQVLKYAPTWTVELESNGLILGGLTL